LELSLHDGHDCNLTVAIVIAIDYININSDSNQPETTMMMPAMSKELPT